MNYTIYKLPNKKKWLLNDAFLETFKEELDKVFELNEKEKKPTYWNTYAWLDSTSGFYKALKITSEKHNVTKAIYEYACRLPYFCSDIFDSELTVLMYKKGIIEEGVIEKGEWPTDEKLSKWHENGEIEWIEDVKQCKGYRVIKKDWRFV